MRGKKEEPLFEVRYGKTVLTDEGIKRTENWSKEYERFMIPIPQKKEFKMDFYFWLGFSGVVFVIVLIIIGCVK